MKFLNNQTKQKCQEEGRREGDNCIIHRICYIIIECRRQGENTLSEENGLPPLGCVGLGFSICKMACVLSILCPSEKWDLTSDWQWNNGCRTLNGGLVVLCSLKGSPPPNWEDFLKATCVLPRGLDFLGNPFSELGTQWTGFWKLPRSGVSKSWFLFSSFFGPVVTRKLEFTSVGTVRHGQASPDHGSWGPRCDAQEATWRLTGRETAGTVTYQRHICCWP